MVLSTTAVAETPLIENDATPADTGISQAVPFYKGRDEGWYRYKKDPGKPKKKDPSKKDRYPDLRIFTEKQLCEMHPDDFNALQTRILKKAVQDPTEPNVVDYMVLQDIARRKALAFANVQTMMAQRHPELTTSPRYPVTSPGQTALVKMRMEEEEATIRDNRDNFALILFTQEECGFCEAQKSIMDYFIEKYQWPVRSIDIEQNSNMAARFNVTMTPSMLIVERNSGEYMPVSTGVLSLADLEDRLYRTIRYMKGEITPQQWFMYNFERGTSGDASGNIK